MSKTEIIGNAIVTFVESKAICPHCDRHIPFEELEEKYFKSKSNAGYNRMKCKCKRFIGFTTDIRGDYVAFDLNPLKHGKALDIRENVK